MLKRIVLGLAVAFTISVPMTASQAADNSATQQIEEYYQGVRDMYREAAKLLGAAQGYDERKPIIRLQRVCSTSLGQLREALNLSKVRTESDSFQLVAQARQMHRSCQSTLENVKKS